MASFRKRPQSRISEEAAPVTTAPTTAALLPEPTTEQAAPEPNPADVAAKESPIEQAEKSAIKKRLAELDGAERLQQEAVDQQVRFAKERQQQVAQLPEHIRRWAEANPRYLSDPIGQAELNVALMKATRDGKNWQDPDFIEVTERHLGIRQQPAKKQPVTSHSYEPPARQAAPVQRQPVRQAYRGPPMSAPPTRDVPSYTTGRPPTDSRLTAEEAQLAKSLGLSTEEYQHQKNRMLRLKEAGVLRD